MIVSRRTAGAPAVGPPHFLPFFAEARRLLGLRVLGADAGLFALAGLFAARFGVAAAAGFGEAFGDAFALAAGAAFLPFDFGSFWPMTTITCARERWGRGSARGGTGLGARAVGQGLGAVARSGGGRGALRARLRLHRGRVRGVHLCVWSRNACAVWRPGARSGLGARGRTAIRTTTGTSGFTNDTIVSSCGAQREWARQACEAAVARTGTQMGPRARAPWSPAESAPRRTP
jgi:hypothetical protein